MSSEKKEIAGKWIIISLKTTCALYGYENKTMVFSQYSTAVEIANQLFGKDEKFIVVLINI